MQRGCSAVAEEHCYTAVAAVGSAAEERCSAPAGSSLGFGFWTCGCRRVEELVVVVVRSRNFGPNYRSPS